MLDVLPYEWMNLHVTQSHPFQIYVGGISQVGPALNFASYLYHLIDLTMGGFGNPVVKQGCQLLESTPNKLTFAGCYHPPAYHTIPSAIVNCVVVMQL